MTLSDYIPKRRQMAPKEPRMSDDPVPSFISRSVAKGDGAALRAEGALAPASRVDQYADAALRAAQHVYMLEQRAVGAETEVQHLKDSHREHLSSQSAEHSAAISRLEGELSAYKASNEILKGDIEILTRQRDYHAARNSEMDAKLDVAIKIVLDLAHTRIKMNSENPAADATAAVAAALNQEPPHAQ